MSRRQFDSSFSRRPANSGVGHQPKELYSLMGDPPGYGSQGQQQQSRGYPSGNGGASRHLYEDNEYYDPEAQSGGGGGAHYEDQYEQQDYDRIPRDGGQRSRILNEFSSSGGPSARIKQQQSNGGAGGWRQRSPSPRYSSQSMSLESERMGNRNAAWTGRPQEVYDQYEDRNRIEQSHQSFQPQQQQQVNPFSSTSTLHQDQLAASALLRNQMGVGASSILGQPEQSVVLVNTAAGGLMGNLALNANPFGVLGQQMQQKPMQLIVGNLPAFATPSPFGQQVLQPTAFGQQGGQQQQGQQTLNIYGPQTQQGFSRFDTSRNNSSDDNNRRSSMRHERSTTGSGGGGSSVGVRRSGGGGGDSRSSFGNKSSSAGRSSTDNNSRKRNLVLRDPHPDDGSKRARTSGVGSSPRAGNRSSLNNRGAGNNRNSGGKPTQVKRISIGDGGVKNNNKTNNRNRRGSNKPKVGASPKGTTTEKKTPAVVVKTEDKKVVDGEATKTDDVDNVEKSSNKKDEIEKKGEGKKDKDKKTKYDDFPSCLLVCKVCQKVMNDGASFESHLNGRAHVSLMKILEERFAKRAELLMNESKCAEDEIGIEMERQRRAGKQGRNEKNANNYCKMCDCNYTVNWGTHKVSLGHRVLKEFLHPTCQFCKVHFMHRKDWVAHLLSSTHIKRLQEIKTEGTTPLDEQESPSQDELFAINLQLTRDEKPTNLITIRSLDGKESLTEEMKEILKNDRGEIILPAGDIPIPEKYDENVEVGEEAIVEVSGSRCRVCRVYIADNKDVEAHCKSKEHFNMYVSFLKRVVRHREHKEEERKAAEEKAKKEAEKLQKDAEKAEKKKADAAAKEKLANEAKSVTENGASGKDAEGNTTAEQKPIVEETPMDQSGQEEKTVESAEIIKVEESIKIESESQASQDDNNDEVKEDAKVTEAEVIAKSEEVIEDKEVTEVENSDDIEMVEVVEKGSSDQVDATSSSPSKEKKTTDEVDAVDLTAEDSSAESKEVVPTPATPATTEANNKVAATPNTAKRGGGRGAPGSAFRGRGGAQALKNVTPRVDSNMRGGGRGQGRGGRANRGSPRGGVGGRGGNRGGRGFR